MLFGFNMFSHTDSFNANAWEEEDTVYKGYTINQKVALAPRYGFKVVYTLTTTVLGTDYQEEEKISESMSASEAADNIKADKKTTLAEAVAFIDEMAEDEDDSDDDTIKGCTYETANNYDESATEDDGSCTYDDEDDDEDDETLSPWIFVGGAVLVTLAGFKLMKS